MERVNVAVGDTNVDAVGELRSHAWMRAKSTCPEVHFYSYELGHPDASIVRQQHQKLAVPMIGTLNKSPGSFHFRLTCLG